MPEPRSGMTALLLQWRRGNREAGDELMAAAYDQLRRLAGHYLRKERHEHSLQATELVNELYLKLCSSGPVEWQDRAHFFAVAARQLRRILVDHARARRADKRGGDAVKVSLTAAHGVANAMETDVLDVDAALTRLEALDPRVAAGVELRFFSGLTETELVEVLGISLTTVRRDWTFARAWLAKELTPSR